MLRQRVADRLSRGRTGSGATPNPSTYVTERASSSEGEEEKEEKDKPWQHVNKEVYEEQLEKLQEQLINTMVENQALQAELEDRKKKPSQSLQKEIDDLKRQNSSLHRQLRAGQRREPSSVSSITSESTDGTDVRTTSLSSAEGGFESVSIHRDSVSERMKRKKVPSRLSYSSARDSVYNFLSLFSEDARTSSDDVKEEPPPLTAKRLKDNLSRVGKSSKPIREFFGYVVDILHWKNSAESLVVFLIYMYCVWNGWIIQLILFIAVTKLTLNYLYISGLAEQFGFGQGVTEEEVDESLGLADKLHLVKQVAQTVQNMAGTISDSLEKLRNLALWRHPEATRKLYSTLWVFLLISLFLPNSYSLTLIGLGMGFKLFIVDNIYRKYPKVQEEFDTVDRMWKALPTDADLLERQSLTQEELNSLHRRPSNDGNTEDNQVSEEDACFCSRFSLPLGEVPLTDWQGGKRCTLMDRDRPLMGSKGGRLFLTYSFLCFERTSKAKDTERMLMPLVDIADMTKAKPFAVLPGNGMAIEITLKTSEKPLMFGAILNRDQVLESIQEQGLILGLPWGGDPDDPCDPSTGDHTPSAPSNQTGADSASGQT